MRSTMTSYFFGSSIRMPPIFTNSALMPSTFIELIFSTNAGGNVFSIPKRIPIFLSAISQILFQNLEGGAPRISAAPLGLTSETPVSTLEILSRHPLPQRPIMLAVIREDIQPMRNPLALKNPSHLYVRVEAHIPIRCSQANLYVPQTVQLPLVIPGRPIVMGIVKVGIVFVVAVAA